MKRARHTIVRTLIAVSLLVSACGLASCAPAISPEDHQLIERAATGFMTFNHLLDSFYANNGRWPNNADELAALNAQEPHPLSIDALRRTTTFRPQADGKLLLVFTSGGTSICGVVSRPAEHTMEVTPVKCP